MSKRKKHPQGQTRVLSPDPVLWTIFTLLIVLIADGAYQYLTSHGLLSPSKWVPIIDDRAIVQGVVALLSVLLVRRQFVLGLQPLLVHKSGIETSEDSESAAGERFWTVTLVNRGGSVAIFSKVEYTMVHSDNEELKSSSGLEITGFLESQGLTRATDFTLRNITSGYAFPKEASEVVFRINTKYLSLLKHLDVSFAYSGILGQRYKRELYYLPHKDQIAMPFRIDRAKIYKVSSPNTS